MKAFLKENWFLILAIIYVLSPIDFIPEFFVPIFGSFDDAGILFIELVRRINGKQPKAINRVESEISDKLN